MHPSPYTAVNGCNTARHLVVFSKTVSKKARVSFKPNTSWLWIELLGHTVFVIDIDQNGHNRVFCVRYYQAPLVVTNIYIGKN